MNTTVRDLVRLVVDNGGGVDTTKVVVIQDDYGQRYVRDTSYGIDADAETVILYITSDEGPGWVSVSDSLPDRQQLVLACYVNSFGKPRIVRAEYATLHTLMLHEDSSGGCACGACDGEYAAVGWYESNEREEVHWIITEPVTHWMPLPAPPITGLEA